MKKKVKKQSIIALVVYLLLSFISSNLNALNWDLWAKITMSVVILAQVSEIVFFSDGRERAKE